MLDMLAMMMAVGVQHLTCPVTVVVPPELAGWATPHPAAGGVLKIGSATTLALVPDARFATAPEKAPAAGTGGTTVNFAIAKPGRYRVALGAPAWIDLVAGGKPVPSIAHGHGPACSGVKKMVDFQLKPGRYTLQLSGADVPKMTVMIAPLG